MPFTKKENRHSDTTVYLSSPEHYIGMVIEKTATISTCVGIEPYTKVDGSESKTLKWDCVLKSTGQRRSFRTSFDPLRMGDVRATAKSFIDLNDKMET